jgi:macrodomain Ter protein organizer (MatP/YcbG family)
VTLAVEKGSESKFAGVGEWVDFSFTRNSRQRLLGLLRQEKYRTKHVTKSIDLEGVAHTGLSEYAAHHQLTFSAAVTKLLEQVFAPSSGERKRPH